MSYAPFGYSPYSASSQFAVGSSSQAGGSPGPCCDRQAMVAESPQSATMCSLPTATAAYDSRLLPHPRLTTTSGLYGGYTSYSPEQAGYSALAGVDSTLYQSLNGPYAMKDNGSPWRGISQPTSYYYDPALAAYGYGGLDLNSARRKNVTRDSTSTLKAWLNEHRKNPYPTKGEKIMLAIITKMTLTQVSTWFANARRRLKKENKMTWEPRNKVDQDADEGKDNAQSDGDQATSDADEENIRTAGSHRFRGAGDQDSLRCGRVLPADGDCSLSTEDGIICRRVDGADCRPPPENPASGTSLNSVPHDVSVDTKPFSSFSDVSPLLVMDSCQQRPPMILPCSVPGFTPSASSHDSSPDLSPIDPSYISSPSMAGESRDSATTVPPTGRSDVASNSALPAKPKIWSLADTATSKSPNSSSLFSSCSGHDSTCDFTSHGPTHYSGNQCGWYAPTATAAITTRQNGGGDERQNYSSSPSSLSGGGTFTSAGVSPYSCAHGFGSVPVQTDTPPQTPPNMKVSVAMQLGPGYLGQQPSSQMYLGQPQACANVHIPVPVDKVSDPYHATNLPPSSGSPYCLVEDSAINSQYRSPQVQ